jgi:hypothetical protein
MMSPIADASTTEAKVKAPLELRLNVAMCSESLANTKLVLAARDVDGKELLKAAFVNGLPGTG